MIVPLAMNHHTTVMESIVDRRQSERFRPTAEVFLTFRPNFERIGSVRDISQTGVSFEYLSFDHSETVEHVEVDIFSGEQNFYISHIPCKVVYNIRKDASFLLHNAETRRCGLQFEQLNDQQASSLLTFLSQLP
jgi:hypothetical protein